jgi:hypothetical protein
MTARLYLDGCSFTYGTGLSQQSTLGHLFTGSGGYMVTNKSRPGKSNLAMALDTYDNISNHDVIVVGWTFGSRTYLKYHNRDIDFLPSKPILESVDMVGSNEIEKSYQELHKQLYSLFDIGHYNKISDMLMSMTYQMALNLNKKIVFFSWDKRDVTIPLLYPHVPVQHRLTCGHLNVSGTEYLYDTLQALLGEQ